MLLEIGDIDLDEILEEFIEKQRVKSLVNVNQPFGGVIRRRIQEFIEVFVLDILDIAEDKSTECVVIRIVGVIDFFLHIVILGVHGVLEILVSLGKTQGTKMKLKIKID